MVKTNLFSVSYGLIVITKDKKTVITHRKIPYCVQNFLMEKKHFDMNNYKREFLRNTFKTLTTNMKIDYLRFLCGLPFEDEYDFARGQMQLNSTKMKQLLKKNNPTQLKFHAFMTAVREFKEETGYSFNAKLNLKDIPIKTLQFIGLDECYYKQVYFIVTVDKLEKCKNYTLENFYEPLFIDITKAIDLFKKQQTIKVDNKHLILEDIFKTQHRNFFKTQHAI